VILSDSSIVPWLVTPKNCAISWITTRKNRDALGSDLLQLLYGRAESIIINQRPLRALSQVERRAARRTKVSSLARSNWVFPYLECDICGMSLLQIGKSIFFSGLWETIIISQEITFGGWITAVFRHRVSIRSSILSCWSSGRR